MKDYLLEEEKEEQAEEMPPMSVTATQKPDWKAYLMDKYKAQGLSDERREALEAKVNEAAPSGASRFLAALGAGMQGRDSAAALKSLESGQEQARNDLKEFDRRRTLVNDEIDQERKFRFMQKEDETFARESDPNSAESKIAQDLARSMGYRGDVSSLTATQWKSYSPVMQKKYEIEQRKLDRQESAAERRQAKSEKEQIKLDKYTEERTTPYGLANTPDDAKKLKEAYESKQNFDRKIQELIDLREEYGVEYFNREAVARGKQLSKDLLLEYKNMAKLGVLSQSDEKIINAIIPDDPLGQDFALGQDPVLHKLKKFQEDSQKDFETKLKTRLKDPGNARDKYKNKEKKNNVLNADELPEI